MSAVKLVALEGPLKGKSKLFADGEYVLGRDESCDIRIDDAAMSGRHATLRVHNSTVTIHDHDSLNGTYINDLQRQTRALFETLRDRDTFALGPNSAFGVRLVELVPAGFWVRFLAVIIDGVLVVPVIFVSSFLIGLIIAFYYTRQGSVSPLDQHEMQSVAQAFGFIWGLLLPLSYVVLMNGARGQTVGKMVLGLKIVRADLGDISYSQALLRYFMQIVLGALSVGIMYIVLALHPERRGWHDMIADTRVIYWRSLP